MSKKIISLLLMLCLVFSIVGCGQNKQKAASNTTEDGVEIIPVKYVVPGNTPKELDKILDKVNAKMIEDGYNLKLDVSFIPWDAWSQKVNLMMSTGEEFDIVHCMNFDHLNYSSRGGLQDITDLIDENGANLRKEIPKWVWDATSINGVNYVIPAWWVESALGQDLITVRGDWLEQNNIELPTNLDEWFEAMKTVKANWKGQGEEPYIVINPDVTACLDMPHTSYETFPFDVVDQMIYVGNDGIVKSWIETDEFKKDAQLWRKCYTNNLLHPDILSISYEQMTDQLNSGDFLTWMGCALGSYTAMKINNPDLKDTDLACFRIDESKPALRTMGTGNMNAISSTSKHPDAAIRFFDWLYSSLDNYSLFTNGIEGEHYTDNGDGTYTPILDESTGKAKYKFEDWMVGNMNLIQRATDSPKRMFDLFNTVNNEAVNSINLGFVFDPQPVEVEYANCKTELTLSVKPLYLGVVDFNENYDTVVKKMKAAGIDKVVAEYEKQFKEWMKTQADGGSLNNEQ